MIGDRNNDFGVDDHDNDHNNDHTIIGDSNDHNNDHDITMNITMTVI